MGCLIAEAPLLMGLSGSQCNTNTEICFAASLAVHLGPTGKMPESLWLQRQCPYVSLIGKPAAKHPSFQPHKKPAGHLLCHDNY